MWLVHKDGFSLGESPPVGMDAGLGLGLAWKMPLLLVRAGVSKEGLVSQRGRRQDQEGLRRIVEFPRPKSNYSCSAATQLKSEELSLPEGKVRVKLDHDGAILDVDEDDIEKVGRRLLAREDTDRASPPPVMEMGSASSLSFFPG